MRPVPVLFFVAAVFALGSACAPTEVLEIGSRLELLVDDYLIDEVNGLDFRLHSPVPQEIVIVHDAPWEGNASGYHTVFQDGGIYRMYYHGLQYNVTQGSREVPDSGHVAYAESDDGIEWRKPELGLIEFHGSTRNNLVWEGPGWHGFTPFIDENPAASPDARYKALGAGNGGLLTMHSPDGIHWSPIDSEPVLTQGDFDSQNLAFWDTHRGEYRVYFRVARHSRRDVRTATSPDFMNWTEPVWLEFPGAPLEQLYTNQVKPYPRAPHILVGFPTRYTDRGPLESMGSLPDYPNRVLRASVSPRYGTAITEGLFMSSRDGVTFRRWGEAYLRPGPGRPDTWAYGDTYIANHLVRTRSALAGAPDELSIYAAEGYYTGTSNALRRYSLRMDGFVSAHAPPEGGELTTKPISFSGRALVLNYSTSGAGGVSVEIQDVRGRPLDGFSMDESIEIYGDEVERVVSWTRGSDLSALVGQAIRLRIRLMDGDLYSIQFRQ
jgi:hypothetical protein